jgi:hypothetical protein
MPSTSIDAILTVIIMAVHYLPMKVTPLDIIFILLA